MLIQENNKAIMANMAPMDRWQHKKQEKGKQNQSS